jgi:inositol transport system substrate-binding protein
MEEIKMKLRKILGTVLLIVMVVSLFAGCGQAAPSASASPSASSAAPSTGATESVEPAGNQTKKKVVMTISNQQNEFIVAMGESFKNIGAELGFDAQLLDAQADPTKQLSQIESAISQGAVGIFIEPCTYDGLTSGLKLANEKNIPVFIIHNAVSAANLTTSIIRCDLQDGGKLKMQQCMDDIGGKGDIAIMTGIVGQDTTNMIYAGYKEVLDQYPDVNVVFEGAGNWGATDAAPLAENWLASGKKLDAIVCMNDGMAMGVLPALKNTGKVDQIKLYGLDATNEGLKAVKAGEMSATIFVDGPGEIAQAYDLLQDVLDGKTVQKEYVIPCLVINKDNVDEYIK